MSFQNYLAPDLRLPIRDKTYVIKEPDYDTGLRAQALVTLGARALIGEDVSDEDAAKIGDEAERDLYKNLLGGTWGELEADGYGWPTMQRVGTTVLLWTTLGLEAAERFWNDESDGPKEPKAPQDHLAKSVPRVSTGSKPASKRQPRKATTAGPTSSSTGS